MGQVARPQAAESSARPAVVSDTKGQHPEGRLERLTELVGDERGRPQREVFPEPDRLVDGTETDRRHGAPASNGGRTTIDAPPRRAELRDEAQVLEDSAARKQRIALDVREV